MSSTQAVVLILTHDEQAHGSNQSHTFTTMVVMKKVQIHTLLGVLMFLLVIGSSLLPVTAQVTQTPATSLPSGFPALVPPSVAQCLPNATANQVQFESMATDSSGVQYLSVLVIPNEAPETTSDSYEDMIGPWRLVISYNQNQCQPMNAPTDPEAEGVEEGARRSLSLDRVQRLISQMGGLDNFLSRLFSFEGDDAHGGDIPENPTITSDMAWVLEQLGVQLPPGWSVAP